MGAVARPDNADETGEGRFAVGPYQNVNETRALQASMRVRQENYQSMQRWGVYSLMKVVPRGVPHQQSVANYVTNLQALSGKTPRQMETLLGLRLGQLHVGADLYRLTKLPDLDGFLPRGYSTLVDGLALQKGFDRDEAGYRPGLGAWQITLIKPVPATIVASLAYDETFQPGPHPTISSQLR